jgi:rod shape-determining protein MreD
MAYRSKDGWRQSLIDSFGRAGLTFLIVLVLVVLSILPLGLKGYGEVRPAFMLMAVYYWSIYRPYMLSPVATFAVGLVLDLLMGTPLGMQALVLVIVRTVTLTQQKFMLAQKFAVMWVFFGLVALGAGLMQWFIFSLMDWHAAALKPVVISACLSTLLFPAVALPLYLINRAMDSRDIFR